METDMMKLSPEDHMEVLTLLMQMEKFPPEFLADTTHNSAALLFPDNLGPHEPSAFHHHHPSFMENPNSDPSLHSDMFYRTGAPPSNCSGAAGEVFSHNGKRNSMAEMREMIFRIAAMQPIHIDPESVKPPKRRNVRISKDPQSVAARHRRERISERIRILQRLVPGGTKMDTASMLDEAIHYVKFLKKQVQTLEQAAVNNGKPVIGIGFPAAGVGHAQNSNYL